MYNISTGRDICEAVRLSSKNSRLKAVRLSDKNSRLKAVRLSSKNSRLKAVVKAISSPFYLGENRWIGLLLTKIMFHI